MKEVNEMIIIYSDDIVTFLFGGASATFFIAIVFMIMNKETEFNLIGLACALMSIIALLIINS